MDYHSVTPKNFEWCVENMANLVIERANNAGPSRGEYRWDSFLNAAPPPAGSSVKNWTEFAHEDVAGAVQERQEQAAKNSGATGGASGGAKSMPVPTAGDTSSVPENVDDRGDGGPSIPQPVPHGETTP